MSQWPAVLRAPCPWCGETMEVILDRPDDTATRVEDCAVCCHPAQASISAGPDGAIRLDLEPAD